MEITWLGHACFRLRGREAVVVTDPCPPSTGYKIGRISGHIVTLSHPHPEHSYTQALTGNPRIITGPGEYEIGGVMIVGVATYHDNQKGARLGKNTAYVIEMDDLRICHLGDLGHMPTSAQAEEMTPIDILLVPVGGSSTIDGAAAAAVVSVLEPRLVIPMHYKTPACTASLDPLTPFLKAMGYTTIAPVPKLSVTRHSLPEGTQVVILDHKS